MVAESRQPPPRSARSASAGSVRLAVSMIVALALSAGIFWLLWTLTNARSVQTILSAIPRIDFSRLKQDTELQEMKRVKPQIDKPEPPPASPAMSVTKAAGVAVGVDVAALAPSGVDFGGFGGTGVATGSSGAQLAFGSGSDRGAVPMVQLDPDYPEAARSRGIEGWVLLQFDVTADGSTDNVIALDARPKGIFEDAAVKAVRGWKYSPKTENGAPMVSKGLRVQQKFELD